MTPEHNTDLFLYLNKYQKLLEQKKGWGAIETWRYSQFRELSNQLSEKTGISVSYMTLTRILQQQEFKRSPQLATLDALAKYLDFEDWEAFCQLMDEQEAALTPPQSTKILQAKQSWSLNWRSVIPIFLVLGILFSIIILSGQKSPSEQKVVLENLSKGDNYVPGMILLKYQVPSEGFKFLVQPASFIAESEKELNQNRLEQRLLDPADSIVSVNLKGDMYPGTYKAMILEGNEIRASLDIDFKTRGWINVIRAKSKSKEREPYKLIFAEPEFNEEGILEISREIDEVMQASFIEKRFEINYFLAQDFGLDANNLQFEARVKRTYVDQLINCKYLRVSLLTTEGMIEIPLVQEGCKSLLKAWVSDNISTYKNRSMEQYETEELGWEKILIKTANKEATIYWNDVLIDRIKYTKPLGKLSCMRFKFDGNGIIDYVKLMDNDGKLIFESGINELQ